MFTLLLPTKPYVHQFLTQNYGNPADISADPRLQNYLRRCLRKPSRRRHANYSMLKLAKYSCESRILISSDDFYRYGWELTRTDSISFNRELENRAKFFMRNMVSLYVSFMNLKDAILLFQENFNYPEDTWSYDSIRKDFDRHGSFPATSFAAHLIEKTESIFLGNLSDLGTICPQFKKNYEKRKQAI